MHALLSLRLSPKFLSLDKGYPCQPHFLLPCHKTKVVSEQWYFDLNKTTTLVSARDIIIRFNYTILSRSQILGKQDMPSSPFCYLEISILYVRVSISKHFSDSTNLRRSNSLEIILHRGSSKQHCLSVILPFNRMISSLYCI